MVAIAVRLLSMFLCSFGGYEVARALNDNFIKNHSQQSLAISVGILLGLLIGYIIGGIIGRYYADALGSMEGSLFRVSGADVFFGAVGALAGLLVALVPAIALFQFKYAGDVIALVLFLLMGTVGARMAIVKRPELSALFKLGPGFATGAQGNETSHILDTSVIIDGRIVDVAKTGFLDGTMVVPRFVLTELQGIADSADTLKRNRGRRGLEVLNALQRLENVHLEITDQDFPEVMAVDGKLVELAKVTGMPLTTNDFNLNKVADLQGVKVLNINQLTNALKPVVLPGEEMTVKVIREGKEPRQGVGYLDDGTMIVVENGKGKVGEEVVAVATSVLQTPAGKMIFTELKEDRVGD